MRTAPAPRVRRIALLLLITTAGCNYITGSRDPQVVVDVLDENGEPFRPDRVYWYYPPVEGTAEEFEGSCLNLQCTRWGVENATSGPIYVAATYSRPDEAAVCFRHAFDALPVEVDATERRHVTLRMEVVVGCH